MQRKSVPQKYLRNDEPDGNEPSPDNFERFCAKRWFSHQYIFFGSFYLFIYAHGKYNEQRHYSEYTTRDLNAGTRTPGRKFQYRVHSAVCTPTVERFFARFFFFSLANFVANEGTGKDRRATNCFSRGIAYGVCETARIDSHRYGRKMHSRGECELIFIGGCISPARSLWARSGVNAQISSGFSVAPRQGRAFNARFDNGTSFDVCEG